MSPTTCLGLSEPAAPESFRTFELNTVRFDFGFNCDTLGCPRRTAMRPRMGALFCLTNQGDLLDSINGELLNGTGCRDSWYRY
jgi:hypothetical protein